MALYTLINLSVIQFLTYNLGIISSQSSSKQTALGKPILLSLQMYIARKRRPAPKPSKMQAITAIANTLNVN